MTDAMGFDVEIGATYGYSRRDNGAVRVIIGKVVKINAKTVTMSVLKQGDSLYERDIVENIKECGSVSINSNTLFKLDNTETNWSINEAKNLLIS